MNNDIIPEKFFVRGSKYISTTGIIWCGRRDHLITEWCQTEDHERKQRIDHLIKIIEGRIALLAHMHNAKKEERRRAIIEADEMIVMLECPSFDCRYGTDAYGIGIRYKDYVPGKLKCDKCGRPLREQNQRNVDNMLFEAGIKF